MNEIPSQLQRWGDRIDQLVVEAEAAKNRYTDCRDMLEEVEDKVAATEEAQVIAQTIAQDIQEKVHAKMSSVVSRCLSAVFEEPYQFKILFERKRGRTEATLVFERDSEQVDPMTASGGGPVDVAAFALRLGCMMLCRPKLRRFIVLDEPFKSPSPHYRERVKKLLEVVSEEMGVQFIMVTNIMELVAGETINLA